MKRIGDAVEEIVHANAALRFGFHHGLLNLTQTAKFIKPLVEARTMKDIKISALVMALSRYGKNHTPPTLNVQFQIDHVRVHHGLVSVTWPKSEEVHRAVAKLFTQVEQKDLFLTVSEGVSEITVITERDLFESIEAKLREKIEIRTTRVTGIGVKFGKRYLNQPGLLSHILQQISFQGINVVEVASTATEFVVYVHDLDAQLAFESIYQRFCVQPNE